MTVGDLLRIFDRIEELERKKKWIEARRDEYLQPDVKIDEIETLIALLKGEVIE